MHSGFDSLASAHFAVGDSPEVDMARVPGMRAANRRLARLGVNAVDMTHCEHGHGCEATARVGRASRTFTVHGAPDPLAAVDELVERIERARRSRAGSRRVRR